MGYPAITAFLETSPTDDSSAEEFAKFYARHWSALSQGQLEAELVPLFRRLKVACEELKSTGRLHILKDG